MGLGGFWGLVWAVETTDLVPFGQTARGRVFVGARRGARGGLGGWGQVPGIWMTGLVPGIQLCLAVLFGFVLATLHQVVGGSCIALGGQRPGLSNQTGIPGTRAVVRIPGTIPRTVARSPQGGGAGDLSQGAPEQSSSNQWGSQSSTSGGVPGISGQTGIPGTRAVVKIPGTIGSK